MSLSQFRAHRPVPPGAPAADDLGETANLQRNPARERGRERLADATPSLHREVSNLKMIGLARSKAQPAPSAGRCR